MQAVAHVVVAVAVCGARWEVRVVEPAIPVARAPEGGGAPLPVPSSLLDMVIGSVKLRISPRISSLVSMAQM